VPAMVIGTPRPDEVATALCSGLPYNVWIMLETEPPLTPISDEVMPIRKP